MEFQPIGSRYWTDIPDACLGRMMEFASLRNEYELTYQRKPAESLKDSAPRMTLPDLFELAVINSREYQREKELLYDAALRLSLERYAYATKFSTRGATVDTTYSHVRSGGTTVNTLRVPSSISGDKLLATGGTLVGQFANDVLLTFNGPSGFAAAVSSDLLFDFTQSIFQRDIVLDGLIQSERNMVYAARRFARYRKQFFLDVAVTYYDILRTYRRIEIIAQNYFSQVRNFQQFQAEVASGISTALNVNALNQYEQGVLSARSSLISQCNSVEDDLDRMKILLGIPTEIPINVDLTELTKLTLRDRIEVNREQARRWEDRLLSLRDKAGEENHQDILTADYSLAERLIFWFNQRRQVNPALDEPIALYRERSSFRLQAARREALADRENLRLVQTSTPPKQRILVFQRQVDLIESLFALIERQGKFATRMDLPAGALERTRAEFIRLQGRYEQIQNDLKQALETSPDDAVIVTFIDRATDTLAGLDTLSQDLDDFIFGRQVVTVDLQETLAKTDALLEFTRRSFEEAGGGLPPVDISVDEAMVTALVQRLDLMNERGALADDWRDIKLAADELKSGLDLQASQRIGTDKNRPFGFSTDNANTRLRLAIDLPLNRKRDRNLYRRSLVNYNVGLRGLQQYEDNIKLNIRRQLRNLEQARVQYPISVSRAALAEEQVISTRLQLVLGLPDVRALDLLVAYDDSRAALGEMVDRRIDYVKERANFALELEAMMLDDTGFWPQVNDPEYQAKPNVVYPWNAGSAYGDYPSFLKVSHEFRRMLHYAPPGANPTTLPHPSPQTPAEVSPPAEVRAAVSDAGE